MSDPLNLLIERHSESGFTEGGKITLHNGNKVLEQGYYGSFSDILIINRGVHEPLEEFCFQQMLKRLKSPPIMLELGAYWAHYSLWVKRLYPNATTIMVEPEEAHLNIGQINFAINGHIGKFIKAFVSSGNFEVDQFMEKENIQKLDILHSDIQGYEVEMLKGANNTLKANKVDYVFISTHSDETHYRVLDSLCSLGYRVEVDSNFSSHTTSYDGLVFATSPTVEPVFTKFKPLGRTDILTSKPEDLVESIHKLLPESF